MSTSGITGGEHLEGLAAALRAAESVLRVEMRQALLDSAPAVIAEMQKNARARLPKAGGLNERVAADPFVVQDRSSTIQAAIRIGTAATDARGSNRGRIRHPVFGHRDRWVEQTYEPAKNWFYDAVAAVQPGVKAKVEAAVQAALEKTARSAKGA